MEVKDAISVAKSYIRTVYSDEEPISNLGLEEVEFDPDDERWRITVGFSRPWNSFRTRAREVLDKIEGGVTPQKRVQKVLVISDADGRVLSMRNRDQSD